MPHAGGIGGNVAPSNPFSNSTGLVGSVAKKTYDKVTGTNNASVSFQQNYGDWLNNAMSGDRDYQRQKELIDYVYQINNASAKEAREWTAKREDTAVIRYANQLKQLGINPYLALGNASGSSASSVATASNASYESGSQFGTLAGAMYNNATDALKSIRMALSLGASMATGSPVFLLDNGSDLLGSGYGSSLIPYGS